MMPCAELPPLTLYVHIPWCVRKCPYCDFNSHQAGDGLNENGYIASLLKDLENDVALAEGRVIESIFIGGGTPSLFSGTSIQRLVNGIKGSIGVRNNAEITMEANPGALDSSHFDGYLKAGVNRLSIGAQSFNKQSLINLGRIHSPAEIDTGFESARSAGFENINIDLMFGLPGQSVSDAKVDLERAFSLGPDHLSYYQLTLEPNTYFDRFRPDLPEEDLIWQMQYEGQSMLATAGYIQYEISAYAKPDNECQHNLNYWMFGDYLGIGAGAHAKLTDISGDIHRVMKYKNPREYMDRMETGDFKQNHSRLTDDDCMLEFMMNALRLNRGVPARLFTERTGLTKTNLYEATGQAVDKGLMAEPSHRISATELGRRYLNDLLDSLM